MLRACTVMVLVAGCGGGGFKTASALPEGPRHPDGVAVDPMSSPPAAQDVAGTEGGMITLRTPLGVDQATATVAAFFRSVVAEDSDGLEALLARDALALNPAGNAGGTAPSAALFWGQRMRRLDYTKLAGEPVFHEAEIEVYRAEDTLEVSPHPAIRTDALSEGDVVVRVPIATPRIGADRLLGDEVLMWLRREGDRYRIYRLVEDFTLN